jgi:hypothetical protein
MMFHQISSLKNDVCQTVWLDQKIMNTLWEGDHEENPSTRDGIFGCDRLTQ